MEVKEKLIAVLENNCPDPNNVFLQGTINPDEQYPDTFITFFITGSEFGSFYDNNEYSVEWSGAIMIYSVDPDTIESIVSGVYTDGKAAGFEFEGIGNDIPSDVETHTGWAIDFIYRQYEQ